MINSNYFRLFVLGLVVLQVHGNMNMRVGRIGGSENPGSRELVALGSAGFLFSNICQKFSDTQFNTERLFFVKAFLRVLFHGDKYGQCGAQCATLCNIEPTNGFLVTDNGKRCTCGSMSCNDNCLWLQEEIAQLTTNKKGPYGENWTFARVAGLDVDVPVMSAQGAILWNYLGQTDPPINVTVTPSEYRNWLNVTLLAVQQLSTDSGVQKAKAGYENYSVALSESYRDIFGTPYKGMLWDYLAAYKDFDLNWIPHANMILNTKSDPNTPTIQDFFSEIGILPSQSRYLSDETSAADVCQCSLPPAGCRIGDTNITALQCLDWKKSSPVAPNWVCEAGPTYECANIYSQCRGSNDKYQEVYRLNGSPVYCCRCTSREPGDPIEGDTACPSTWTPTSTCDFYGCKISNGTLSIVFGQPSCCDCENSSSRRLGIYDKFQFFYNVIVNGCFSKFGTGMGGLSTAADVADAAGFRAINGFVKGLGAYSCYERAGILADVLFKDDKCLIKYAEVNDIIVEGCAIIPQCGTKGFPLRSRAYGRPINPMTYFLKHEGICQQRRWDDEYSGALKWCG